MFPLKGFYWGQKGARDNFALQIRNIVEHGYRSLGETPVIIGECGIPMDMKCVSRLLQPDMQIFTQRCSTAKAKHSKTTGGIGS